MLLEGIIVGAASALGMTALGHRFFLSPRRVRDATATGVRDQDDESEMDAGVRDGLADRGRGRPGRVRGPGDPDRGPGIAVADATGPEFRGGIAFSTAERGTAWLPAVEHIERFIDWVITDEDGVQHTVCMRDTAVFYNYLDWATKFGVVPLPEKTLQTLLGKRPEVKRSRERVKDRRTGKVVRLATDARSPLRETVYTIHPPRAEPVLPGKPPVADVVPERPVLTKKQREAAKAQPTQPGQPLPEQEKIAA